MKQRLAGLLVALLPLIARGAEPAPVIAVVVEDSGMKVPGALTGPRWLTVAWPDGRIVWSRDQEAGGPPYLTARIEPARVQELLKRFEERGVFEKRGPRRSWFGPDSSHHSVWLQAGDRRARLETWHELFERNPKTVVIDGAVTSLGGRNRDEVVRKDTKAFREFRELWSDLRSAVAALLPRAGEPYAGPLEVRLPP